jgi:hypothetical protein
MSYRRNALVLIAAVSAMMAMPLAAADSPDTSLFTDREKRIIEGYLLKHPDLSGGRPGKRPGRNDKAGRKVPPPGIAKNLQRGKPLPPGIAKNDLPSDLSAELPKRPGYERVIVDARIVLIEVATGIVRDILEDVLLPD